MAILSFSLKKFADLSLEELYGIMAARQEVFAVEQQCIYQDADGKDAPAWHLMGKDSKKAILAYARLLPKTVAYPDYASIGRVLTHRSVRKFGLGRQLMQEAMAAALRFEDFLPIKISAQVYLIDFYHSFGFITSGQPYLEDGMLHQAMIYKGPAGT